jgi:hypothetical protein
MSDPGRRTFIVRWIGLVALGETLGFAVAVAVAVAVSTSALPPAAAYATIVAAGAVEGGLLGLAQQTAIGRARLARRSWAVATAVGAAVAWSIGLLPSTMEMDLSGASGVVVAVLGGLVLLAAVPTAQWSVLNRPGTVRWIPVNMVAWAVAILWTFAPSPLVDESTPVAVVVPLYAAAGLLMAVTVAVLTAPTAASLFLDRVHAPSSTSTW